jgi:hypothetical protein
MKSVKFLIMAAITLIFSTSVDAQIFKTVRGNGNVITKERTASSFNGISVSTGIDVYLKQGDKETISIEADENLQDYIITEVKGGVLHVYSEYNIREAKMKRVHVTMKEITSLKTSSAGDIVGETQLKGDKIQIGSSSAGNIKVDLIATQLDVNISSSGDVELTGEADKIDIDLSSAGDLSAYDLKVKEADISASSAGDAKITVSERLTANVSSAADVSYRGNPKYIMAHSSSAGSIRNR